MKIVVKYPTRGRPSRFIQTLKLYQRMAANPGAIRFVVSIDEDDSTMNNDEMRRVVRQFPTTSMHVGQATSKISAVNLHLDQLGEFDILILASDDMLPVVKGYDHQIIRQMHASFPAKDGVLHYWDGFNQSHLNTMPIMGKALLDSWGYIYHPAYRSEWCDNEFDTVTTNAGKSWKSHSILFKHEWVRATGQDATFRKNSGYFERDKKVYLARKAAGFPKEWPHDYPS